MAQRGDKSLIQLDWFNITYKTIYSLIVLGVLVVGGGGGSWYYLRIWKPRTAASEAIAQAEERYRSASGLARVAALEETLQRAGQFLEEARGKYSSKNYGEARFAALHSADLSSQALDKASGETSESPMVRFYRIEGDVRVRKAGEFSWESASPNMTMRSGDQVKTSSSSSAQLIYFDGTVTTVQPGSLLEIRDLYEDPVTKVRRVRERLSWGELEASTSKRNVRGSYHEVSTDKVAARSEEAGEFRVSYDPEQETTVVDNFRGQLQISGGGKRESLTDGERIQAAADGSLGGKEVLPGVPRLMSPADQRVFIFDRPAQESVSLSWETVAGAARYHLMISDNQLFTDPLYDNQRGNTSATLAGVPTGAYFWKVAAIDPAGAKGRFSEPRGFRVSSQKIRDRDDNVPPGLEITEFVTIGMMVIVNGQSEPGVSLWVDNEKIDVYDDGRFYAVVKLRKEGWNKLQFRAQDTAGNETTVAKSAYVEFY